MASTRNGRLIILALIESAIIVALSLVWFQQRTTAYLAGPPDGDLYAFNEGFQWAMYLIYYLPLILLVNWFILLIMYGLAGLIRKRARS